MAPGDLDGTIGPLAVLTGVALSIWKLNSPNQASLRRSNKSWRGLNVDEDLKDEWLERLNSIEGISIGGSCAGHPGSSDYGLEESRAFLSLGMNREGQALKLAKKAFGDLAFYDPKIYRVYELPTEERERIDFENTALARQQGKMFQIGGGTHGIHISSPYSYDELRGDRFEEWWETLVSKVEEMGEEARKQASS